MNILVKKLFRCKLPFKNFETLFLKYKHKYKNEDKYEDKYKDKDKDIANTRKYIKNKIRSHINIRNANSQISLLISSQDLVAISFG